MRPLLILCVLWRNRLNVCPQFLINLPLLCILTALTFSGVLQTSRPSRTNPRGVCVCTFHQSKPSTDIYQHRAYTGDQTTKKHLTQYVTAYQYLKRQRLILHIPGILENIGYFLCTSLARQKNGK